MRHRQSRDAAVHNVWEGRSPGPGTARRTSNDTAARLTGIWRKHMCQDAQALDRDWRAEVQNPVSRSWIPDVEVGRGRRRADTQSSERAVRPDSPLGQGCGLGRNQGASKSPAFRVVGQGLRNGKVQQGKNVCFLSFDPFSEQAAESVF